MAATMSTQEQQLCQFLKTLGEKHGYRYTQAAQDELLKGLFWCMACGNRDFMNLLFPVSGGPLRGGTLNLREAQGAVDGSEYTEGARGHACGHIFRAGEATYVCRTCGSDDTCCLCSRCFESTDHRGHIVRITVSPGNSGCCDCGDPEAWRTPMLCTIHSALDNDRADAQGAASGSPAGAKDKGKATAGTPPELEASIRMTVGRVLDFMCDVVSCSPEQLRQTKSVESIQQDERMSRLASTYGGGDVGPPDSYAVLLWNDEKHTVSDVAAQVARACLVAEATAVGHANTTDEVGRCVLMHSTSIEALLKVARILEEIKITVTVRSSRDTFREQMCGTLVEWLSDIAGCRVGNDHYILRRIVCEELLGTWHKGSPAAHAIVGENGMDDEDRMSQSDDMNPVLIHEINLLQMRRAAQQAAAADNGIGDDADDDYDDDYIEDAIDDILDDDDDDDDGGADAGADADADAEDGNHDHTLGGDEADAELALLGPLRAQAGLEGDDVVMVDMQAEGDIAAADGPSRPNEANDTADRGADGDMVMEGGAWQPSGHQPAEDGAPIGGAQAERGAVPQPQEGSAPAPSRRLWRSASASASASATRGSGSAGPATASTSRRNARDRDVTPSDSDTAEPLIAPTVYAKTGLEIPKTPGNAQQPDKEEPPNPGRYWLGVPSAYMEGEGVPPAEDLFQRVRLDWLILFDMRLWKRVRNALRALYISTVVTIPEFKRVLGLRFSGLYTTLAQLYLIGDREPDHSIINISLQMLTTPSITAEIVERGNFLTSLMAILYTFLTTRQVGYPWDVFSNAVLAFDSGTVTNRRMYHFFIDLKYLFASPHVQECLRTEDRYMMQFLDLVKLHQGICPNTRAVGEHVEYETDTWISASLITREINRLCRQFADAFRNVDDSDFPHLARAIRYTAKTVILNSIGAERLRFSQAEIRDEVRFRALSDFEFDHPAAFYDVVRFVVEEQPISFHHALHYTLSWLLECAKTLPVEHLRSLLSFTAHELKSPPRAMGRRVMPRRLNLSAEDYLMAAFDYPLRVCAWLAQIKASMWVRNGISLRHQAATYRGVGQRDVAHHRDILLLQTALVVCNPSRVLVSIIDRFGMERWVKGIFEQKAEAQDDMQHLDVVEDMIHLLIVLVSDRTALLGSADEAATQMLALRRDIVHVLCFKPLSYTDICNRLPDRFQEQEIFQTALEDMTTYKAPDGNTDVGTFELHSRYIEEVDPYSAHYNKNQREESETAYRKWMAKKTGQPADDIVFEPKLQPIASGAFVGLADFTGTGVFAQLIYYSLLYPLVAQKLTRTVPFSRIETFLQVVLHLVLIAIAEDKTQGTDQGANTDADAPSFVRYALDQKARSNFMPESPEAKTIASLLTIMSTKDEFKACHTKITLILKRMRQKRPVEFEAAYARLGISVDRISTASPGHDATSANEERERKKRAALDRQARVMAQFQEQQKSFLANQGDIDWGIVDDDDGSSDGGDGGDTAMGASSAAAHEAPKKLWKYPSGTCILCQEDTDDRRLHGTFAFFTESRILRKTDLQDPDFVREAAATPANLDRSAERIRPFGVAHENRKTVVKIGADGNPFEEEQQVIGRGFPSENCEQGTLSIGCGHIMHYHCFEAYFEATLRRHNQQIARHHPEDTERLEFVCPLCKALGNAFLPIVWKGKEESYPGALVTADPFADYLDKTMTTDPFYAMGALASVHAVVDDVQDSKRQYVQTVMVGSVADKAAQLLVEAWELAARGAVGLQASAGLGGPVSAAWSPLPAAVAGAANAAVAAGAGAGIGSSSGGVPGMQPAPPNILRDLVAAYRRLKRTLRTNSLPSHHVYSVEGSELASSDTLAQAVGYSISAVEIQQRGTDAEYGMTLLSKVPEQVLTHLRILCETVTSYIAVGAQRLGGNNRIELEYRADAARQHCQLFIAQYMGQETEMARSPVDAYAPLLGMDPFLFLCESVFGVVAAHKMPLAHILRFCYLAELVKVVYRMGRSIPAAAWINVLTNRRTGDDAALDNFATFCLAIAQMNLGARSDGTVGTGAGAAVPDALLLASDVQGTNHAFDQEGLNTLEGCYHFVQKYALVFLRKSAVLLYATAGIDFNSHVSPAPELSELERLSEALKLPSFDGMCSALTDRGPATDWPTLSTHRLVEGWIRHDSIHARQRKWEQEQAASMFASSSSAKAALAPPAQPPSALLSHPGIYELVGLPLHYDHLLDECTRARCPTTGKDVSDPMLCLLCGAIFCGQAICCLKAEPSKRHSPRRIGGAQQHMRKCQKNIGLFLNIRKCCIYYLHRLSGSYGHAPYIDKYGEVDLGFRHGRPLLLNQRRYDAMLRAVWLSHGVPSFISRKLEMDINNGGWETI